MAELDNPAGRLHELLSALAQQNGEASLAISWAGVLGVTEAELPLALAPVAQLVPDTEAAVNEVGDQAFVKLVVRHRPTWSSVIFPVSQPFNTPLKSISLPPPDAMETLDAVASHPHREASEGPVPPDDQLAEVAEQLMTVLEEVKESDLPDEVKQLVLKRLQDIISALSQISTTGPAGVRSAVEILIGAVAVTPAARGESPVWKKVFTVVLATYALFSAGPDVQASLEAWPQVEQTVIEMVSGGHNHPAPPPSHPAPADSPPDGLGDQQQTAP